MISRSRAASPALAQARPMKALVTTSMGQCTPSTRRLPTTAAAHATQATAPGNRSGTGQR